LHALTLIGMTLTLSNPDGTVQTASLASRAEYGDEWAFVLRNEATIERYATSLAKADARLSADDLRGEAIEWILRLYGSYDPAKAAESSWIYFMVRRARQKMLVALNRQKRAEVLVDPQAMYGERGYAPEPHDHGDTAERTTNLALANVLAARQDRARLASLLFQPEAAAPRQRAPRRPRAGLEAYAP
jgi:hypothetical protein